MITHTLALINDSLSSIAPSFANHLWQSTAFALAAWLVTLLLRSNAARVRYAIWLAASLKFLLPFSLLVSLGALLPRPQHVVATAPIDTAVDAVALPFSDDVIAVAPVIAHPSRTQLLMRALPAILAVLWLSGALTVLAVWLARWRRISATRRRAIPAHTGLELEILRRLQASTTAEIKASSFWRSQNLRIGLWNRRPLSAPTTIPLLLSPDLMEPGIVGILRPALLWPARLSSRLEDQHIEAILAHELMHVRRRDNLAAALHMFVETLFWFHPLVWFIERRIVEERERACDQAVVQLGSAPGIYADSLLKACRFCVESPLACVSGITGADLNRRVRSIMTLRLARLTLPRKLLLASLALAAIAAPIMLGQANAAQRMMLAAADAAPKPFRTAAHEMLALEETPATSLIAEAQPPSTANVTSYQAQADAKPFTFDVVSIRPANPNPPPGPRPVGSRFTDDGFVGTNQSLLGTLLFQFQQEFQIDANRIVGGPDWARTLPWDIHAKVADSDIPEWTKLTHDPSAAARERRRATILAMLAERFKLKTHIESREGTVYALVVAKGGPKLKPSTPDSPTQAGFSMGQGHLSMNRVAVGTILPFFVQELGHPLIDKTGITGTYDITLDWAPGGDAGQADPPSDPSKPSLFTAFQEQLGLKLEAQKGPIETLVIDSAEKPSLDGAELPNSPTLTAVSFAQQTPSPAPAAPASQILHSTGPLPAFEVATIKPPDPKVVFMIDSSGANQTIHTAGNGRWLVAQAFQARYPAQQVVGLPPWAEKDTYDYRIEAKIPDDVFVQMQTLGADERHRQIALMMQSLLADRMKLKFHFETREMPVYDLIVAKGGPKLPPPNVPISPDKLTASNTVGGMVVDPKRGIRARNVTLDGMLSTPWYGLDGRPIVNKTGLTGTYNLTLSYFPNLPGPGGAPPASDSPVPNADADRTIFSVLEDDLGLKLVPSKGPVEVIVIDHIEPPSEN